MLWTVTTGHVELWNIFMNEPVGIFPYCRSAILRLKILRSYSGLVYRFSLWNIYTAVGTI